MIAVTVPLVTVNESNARTHWRNRARRAGEQRPLIAAALRAASNQRIPLPPLVVVITRQAPRRLDDDGAVAAVKAVRDGVADFLKLDDRDPRISWHVEQAKAPKGREAITVMVRLRDERDERYDAARAAVLAG